MTWYAVYREDTGELVSTGSELADPMPEGLSSVEIDGQQSDGLEWDPSSHSFVAATTAPARDRIAEFRNDPDVQRAMSRMDQNSIATIADVMARIFGDVRSL